MTGYIVAATLGFFAGWLLRPRYMTTGTLLDSERARWRDLMQPAPADRPVVISAISAAEREMAAPDLDALPRLARLVLVDALARAEAAEAQRDEALAKVAAVEGLLFRRYVGSPQFEETPEHVREIDALADLYDADLASDLRAALATGEAQR